jgi:hypothetical protein
VPGLVGQLPCAPYGAVVTALMAELPLGALKLAGEVRVQIADRKVSVDRRIRLVVVHAAAAATRRELHAVGCSQLRHVRGCLRHAVRRSPPPRQILRVAVQTDVERPAWPLDSGDAEQHIPLLEAPHLAGDAPTHKPALHRALILMGLPSPCRGCRGEVVHRRGRLTVSVDDDVNHLRRMSEVEAAQAAADDSPTTRNRDEPGDLVGKFAEPEMDLSFGAARIAVIEKSLCQLVPRLAVRHCTILRAGGFIARLPRGSCCAARCEVAIEPEPVSYVSGNLT